MTTIVTRAGKGSALTNSEMDSNTVNLKATADAALPKAGGAMTGAITTNSTFDGVDIATRDAVLTSTTTTANAALPKAGGTLTGNLSLGDNVKLQLGNQTNGDLQIYHDGSHSYIKEVGAGDLLIYGTNLHLRDASGYDFINCTDTGTGGTVTLFNLGSAKLATTSTGIDVTGLVAADSLTVDNFTLDGTTLALSSGDMLVDVAGNITLDADGGNVNFNDSGANIGTIYNNSNNFAIYSAVSNADMKFQGNSGGNITTALTLDMSASGAATFSGVLTANAGVVVDNFTIDGNEIDVSSGDLTLDVAGNIILDADGGYVLLKDAGVQYGGFYTSSSDLVMQSYVQDKDIIFYGNDGGSGITALTLDMSDAGAATFNSSVTLKNTLSIGSTSGAGRTMVFADISGSPAKRNWVMGAQYNTNDGWELTPSTAAGGSTFTNRVLTAYGTTGNLVVNENGIDADFRVESSGNANMLFVDGGNNRVGIGTGTPGYALEIDIANVGGLTDMRLLNSATTNAASGARCIIGVANGDVGDPRLVLGITGIQEYAIGIDNSDSDILKINNGSDPSTSTNYLSIGAGAGGVVINDGSADLDFRVESDSYANMLFVDGGNNSVGVKMATPASYLATEFVVGCVDEGGITLAALSGSTKQNIYFADGTSGSARNRGNISYDHIDDSLSMGTASGSTRFLMDNAGLTQLSVGLTVARTTGLGGAVATINSNNAQGLAIGYGTGTNEYRRLYHHSTGLYFESSTNQAYLNAAGVWTDASDITYKKDIEDIDYGIETVKKLKPRKYKMKSDDTEQIGFVAQELVEQVPEIVSEKDGILGVAYGQLTAVLTKAIQEQQTLIESLTARIAALEEQKHGYNKHLESNRHDTR